MKLSKHLFAVTGAGIVASLLIFFPVFSADYAFTDEAHQLWNNHDKSNFVMFLNQGRLITGWLIDWSFGKMNTVSDIKWLRLFSFASMLLFIVLYARLSKKLFSDLGINSGVWALSVLFIPCSLSSAVYIGWASCAEIFTATLAAFLSGYFLFNKVNSKEAYLQVPTGALLLSLLFALVSLFTYQTAFGFFLLPFFLCYVQRKTAKPDRAVLIGVMFYLLCYVVYYLLFKYSLKLYDVPASDRASINIDPLGKLSFFFSYPLAQAFSFNFLYNARSVLSQVFYPLVILFWLIRLYFQMGKPNAGKLIAHLAVCIVLLMLVYLPLMISLENFASYRTMFALNFLVVLMICEMLITFFQAKRLQTMMAVFVGLVFFGTACYNYRINFSKPLEKEYAVLHTYLMQHGSNETEAVFFKRPPVNLFKPAFGVNYYTDEFGYPSTEKDWTPEPLIKQLFYEKTGSREKARLLPVESFAAGTYLQTDSTVNMLLIDMQQLFVNEIETGRKGAGR